jgi:hypothetical protein
MPMLGIMASQISGKLSSYDSISTATVTSGGTASITFSSIPQTYTHIQIRLIAKSNRSTNALSTIGMEFNGDSTGTNYNIHQLYGDGSGATSSYGANYFSFDRITGNTAGATNMFGAMIFDILDYTNTNKYKTLRMLGGADVNGAGEMHLDSGLWRNTSAITSLSFLPNYQSTLLQEYTSVALYGIK